MASMKVFKWTIYTVVIPLMPLLFVTAIAIQPEHAIPYERILGGTEIFLACLFVSATTYRDWDNEKANLARSNLWECLSLSLHFWVNIVAIMSAFVFIHVHIQDLGLHTQFVANVGIVFGILTTTICLSAQVLLAKGEKKKKRGVAAPVVS